LIKIISEYDYIFKQEIIFNVLIMFVSVFLKLILFKKYYSENNKDFDMLSKKTFSIEMRNIKK